MFPYRHLPSPLPNPDPYAYTTSYSDVQWTLEEATNSDPFGSIDYGLYMTVLGWCRVEDNRKIVEDVLKGRLALPSPASDKALILAQALPSTSLPILLEPLKKLAAPSNPMIAAIHANLLAQAETADGTKKNEEQKQKWELWSNLYGKSKVDWTPLPKENVEWGWWAAYPVDSETWWSVPPME